MPEIDLSYWEIVITHEAGHAIASLILWGESADIFIRGCNDEQGNPSLSASFRIKNILNQKMGSAPPLQVVQVCAAGAQAERLRLHLEDSKGFKSDQAKIDFALIRAKRLGGEDEAQVVAEIDGGYPRTRQLLDSQQAALTAIVQRAMESLVQMCESGNLVANAVVLTANRVREIYEEQQGTDD
jgi:hypothetical protein